MSKKIKSRLKLQIPGGQASPAPPIGPILGQQGINIQDFCTKFNQETKDKQGEVLSVDLIVYEDRSFDFKIKGSPVSFLLKKAVGAEKGSGRPNVKKVGKISKEKVREIAQKKLEDLNTNDLEKAMKIVEGTARSMGIEIE